MKDLWSSKRQPTLVLLPGESHGQKSLAGSSAWGCKELDMTEQLSAQHTLKAYWALDDVQSILPKLFHVILKTLPSR